MAARPTDCPVCNKSYFSRVSSRYDDKISLSRCYRHDGGDGYIYIHEIPTAQAAEIPR